jgi:hypothetical protein
MQNKRKEVRRKKETVEEAKTTAAEKRPHQAKLG